MTRRRTRFAVTLPPFVGELEQVRLVGGNGAPLQLEDRLRPATLLLRLIRETRRGSDAPRPISLHSTTCSPAATKRYKRHPVQVIARGSLAGLTQFVGHLCMSSFRTRRKTNACSLQYRWPVITNVRVKVFLHGDQMDPHIAVDKWSC